MVRCLVLVSALLLASVWAPADCQLDCPRTRLQIVTRNTTLLSPSNITATRSGYNGFPPSHFGNFTPAVWCARAGPNPNISLSFSQLVLITGFIPGGYSARNDGSNREYVTNFNLRYSENLDGNEFSSPQEFTISAGANLDQLVMLENPFLALRLHIQVNSFVTTETGDICMGMAFYGCHHSEATQVQQTSDCPSVIPHPESTPALQSPQSQVVRDYQALAIALPIALITIVITVAIVGVGVALCIREKVKEKEPRSPVKYALQESDSVRVFDNAALYQSTEQEDGRETIKEVKNVLYEDDSARLEENPEYSVPWNQDQNGAVQMRSNVSYSPSPVTPSRSGAAHEYSTLSGVYEEPH